MPIAPSKPLHWESEAVADRHRPVAAERLRSGPHNSRCDEIIALRKLDACVRNG